MQRQGLLTGVTTTSQLQTLAWVLAPQALDLSLTGSLAALQEAQAAGLQTLVGALQ